jgi:predicted nucleotidyltransferase
MDLDSLLAQNKDGIREICRRYGASNIRVFGSVARHDAGEASDIDLLVDLEPGRTLFDLGGLSYDLERLLGRHVDVATPGLLRARIRSRILQEAVPL